MKKWFLFLIVLLVGSVGWYGFVSSGFLSYDTEIELVSQTSPSVFLDSDKLNNVVLVFKSNQNLKNHILQSSCDTETEFLDSYKSLHFFKVTYLDPSCSNPNLTLKKGEDIIVHTLFQINLVNKSTLFNFLVDYPDSHLQEVNKLYARDIQKNAIYANYSWDSMWKYFSYLKWQRKLYEAEYKKELVDYILQWRWEKYLIPVPGYHISDHAGRLPNAPRWYRAWYTDGIHHWWDIYAPLWADTVALDDGLIVRIVRWFEFEDLWNINRWPELSKMDKLKNLDILRWNQVWLKTTKWDVVFYSHLRDVSDDIQEGDMVTSGTYLGSVWVSWVPEVWYDDYHLHFAVQTNPYNLSKVWSYTFDDYMEWDWLYRWESADHIIDHKHEVFSH